MNVIVHECMYNPNIMVNILDFHFPLPGGHIDLHTARSKLRPSFLTVQFL